MKKIRKVSKNAVSMVLAMALLLAGCFGFPTEAKAEMTEVSIEQEISILGIDGKTYSPSDMEEDVVVLIFGNTSCSNTNSMITKAEELLARGTSIKIVLMDEETTDDGMEGFAANHPNVLVAHDGANYNWLGFQLMNQAGITFRSLPGTFLMDKDRVIRYASQGLDTDGLEEAISTLTDVPGATKKQLFTVQVTGTYGQTEARTMLQMINEFRTGEDAYYLDKDDSTTVTCSDLGELVYDYGLEKIAMQRAMEIALSFEHTRPNGNSCFTAYTEDYSGNGENIAFASAGYGSAATIFNAWREDDKLYAGQGHRRNMLNSEYKAIGIGHVYYNGRHYWVQEFSGTVADTNEVVANNSDTTVSVEVSSKKVINMGISVSTDTVAVAYGQEASVPTATAWIRLTNSLGYCPIVSEPEWSGTSKYYDLNGSTITGKAIGADTITVTAAGMSQSVTVNVEAVSISSGIVTLDPDASYTYTGSTITPAVSSVVVGGKTLTEGTDYDVEYSNNVNAGTAFVTITGKGNYKDSIKKAFTIKSNTTTIDESSSEEGSSSTGTTTGTTSTPSETTGTTPSTTSTPSEATGTAPDTTSTPLETTGTTTGTTSTPSETTGTTPSTTSTPSEPTGTTTGTISTPSATIETSATGASTGENGMTISTPTNTSAAAHLVKNSDGTNTVVGANGTRVISQKVTIDGKDYVTDMRGVVITNKITKTPSGNKVYVGKDGAIAKNKVVTNQATGKRYYATKSGTIANKKGFYITAKGNLVYVKNKNGEVKTSGTKTKLLFTANGKQYIAKRSGVLYTSTTVKIGNTKYTVNENGVVTKKTGVK
jgi:uncharacterized protein YkwD